MSTVLQQSLAAWWPELWVAFGGLAAVLVGVWRGGEAGRAAAHNVAGVAVLAAVIALARSPVPPPTDVFFGMITCDPFSLIFRWIALITVALVLLMSAGTPGEVAAERSGEYVGLLLFVGVGLMLLAEAHHLLMAYLALELVSISSYLLVGFLGGSRSAEAALKYLLFGALTSGVMLFGMSLLYGVTGQLDFAGLAGAVDGLAGPLRATFLMAVAFLLAGVAFKISMVPFHLWTPDAYEGAPVAVAALLSVGPKAAGLALFLRLLHVLAPAWAALGPVLLALAVATMTLGNLAALAQRNVKRLLAYSTIAQVGYILIGLVVATPAGQEAVLVYLVAYLFMNLGAFACVAAVVHATGSESLGAFQGLARRAPGTAALLALFLLSLAGMPPLVGFIGKFLLLGSAIGAGLAAGGVPLLWLAGAAVVNSAIALYYYVNILRLMYLVPASQEEPLAPGLPVRLAAGLCAVATLGLGLFPAQLLNAMQYFRVMNLL